MVNMDKAVITECECGGYHYLQIDEWEPGEAMMALVDRPNSFWHVLKHWWRHRSIYVGDIILRDEDITEVIRRLVLIQRRGMKHEAKKNT